MKHFDVLVVGGGAAGLTAAMVLLRARRTVAVVDAGAPRNAPAHAMHGFLSRDGVAPAELLAAGRAEVAGYGGVFVSESVTEIRAGFRTTLADGTELSARRILVATGLTDQLPELPGLRERWGRDVLHCPYCHGFEVRDQPLAVLGGAPESVQHALLLRQWSDDVELLSHTDVVSPEAHELLAARGVRVIPGRVSRLVVEHDRLRGLQLADGTFRPRTAVFVRPGLRSNSELLRRLGCDMDAAGWPITDAMGGTSIRGVRVAGNVADPRAQVITAAGQGSAAAIATNADLVNEDVEDALKRHRAAH